MFSKVVLQPVHLSYCFDKKYQVPFYISLASVFFNNRAGQIILHVISNDIDEIQKMLLEKYVIESGGRVFFYELSTKQIHDLPQPEFGHFTKANYLKIFIPNLVGNYISKLLYLDVDVLVLQDLLNLYSTPLKGFVIGAAVDNEMHVRPELGLTSKVEYFNSGVLLFDTITWKSAKIEKSLLDFVNRNTRLLKFADQDALNAVLRRKWYEIDNKFNVMSVDVAGLMDDLDKERFIAEQVVIHFNGLFKPWHSQCQHPLRKLYYSYVNIFTNSAPGKELMNKNLEAKVVFFIIQVLALETVIDLDTIFSFGFYLHVMWIKALEIINGNFAEILPLMREYYGSLIFKTNFKNVRNAGVEIKFGESNLKEIYLDIMTGSYELRDDLLWLSRWKELCLEQLTLKSDDGNRINGFSTKIPDIINVKLNLSSQLNNLLFRAVLNVL